MGLADFCIRRPVFAVMLIAGLVGLGWNSMSRVGVDLFPRVEYPFISVATILEGATPETVETELRPHLVSTDWPEQLLVAYDEHGLLENSPIIKKLSRSLSWRGRVLSKTILFRWVQR